MQSLLQVQERVRASQGEDETIELKDVGNCSGPGRFQFGTKEAKEGLQKAFILKNTQRVHTRL